MDRGGSEYLAQKRATFAAQTPLKCSVPNFQRAHVATNLFALQLQGPQPITFHFTAPLNLGKEE